ncbi:MAG: TonB-dependent receptor family protein [Betaproteobacteria bacterium]
MDRETIKTERAAPRDFRTLGLPVGQLFCLALSLFAAGAVLAQEGSIQTAPIVVTPTRVEQSSFDLPVAVNAIDAETIQEARPAVNISETLVRVPGVVVQNRETFAQEQQIIVRGFGARAGFGVRGIKLLADGIPASTPDGQGGTGLFDLGSARSIEVLRGPFSALYGNHSGGVVQIFTEDGPERPTVTPYFSAGSYDTWRAGTKFGGQAGNLNYIANLSHYETDGYRDHSAARKDQFNSKFDVRLNEHSALTLVLNYLNQPDNEDPLGLTAAQVAQNPSQTTPDTTAGAIPGISLADRFNTGRNLSNLQTGAVYETAVNDQDRLRFLAYVGRRSNDSYLAVGTDSVTTSGGVSILDRDFYGLGARWTRNSTLVSRPITVTLGADYDSATDARKGYVNDNGTATFLKRDEDNTADSAGAYIQTEWLFAEQWSASAGLRYTKVDFESADHYVCRGPTNVTAPTLPVCPGAFTSGSTAAVNPDDSGSVSHDAWTPVAGLVFKATPVLNFYASAGKSFETPTLIELAYRPDGSPGLNFALEPSTSNHYELGTKMFVGTHSLLEAAVFQIDTEKEIVVASNSGGRQAFKNAGDTQRRGAELSVNAALGYGFTGYVSATYLEANFEESFTSCSGIPCVAFTVPAGNRIPAVPRYNVYTDLAWRHLTWGFSTGLEVRWQGGVAVDDLNSEFADSYVVTAIRAQFEQRSGEWRLTEFARVDNLLDEQYIGAVLVNDGNGRFYAPAADRNFTVGMNASYAF